MRFSFWIDDFDSCIHNWHVFVFDFQEENCLINMASFQNLAMTWYPFVDDLNKKNVGKNLRKIQGLAFIQLACIELNKLLKIKPDLLNQNMCFFL